MSTTRLQMYPTSINQKHLDLAVKAMRQGGIIIYPTDTFYAYGCDALNQKAIEQLCRIKGINPLKTNLSIVCASISQAAGYARIDNRAFDILRRNLPGPFTFLLPSAPSLPRVFRGRKTVGVRVPSNPIATALATALGNPLLSTSLPADPDMGNIVVTPDEADLINPTVASIIIDAGECGHEQSTIVNLTDSASPVIERPGAAQLI